MLMAVTTADIQRRATDLAVGRRYSLYSSVGHLRRQNLGTKSGHLDRGVDGDESQSSLLERLLVSVGLLVVVALIYQLMVGGIKIELANGRPTIDVSGFVYWWQVVTGAITPHK
jgi:hypothetical protein